MDYSTLEMMRRNHPAWRLLRSDHAALVASFLNRAFVEPNLREVAQADLVEKLEDTLFGLRESLGEEAFPRTAQAYLNEWAEPDKGWVRKFYRPDSDEPYFDMTPATEKALTWLSSLSKRSFVGTESRLLTLFNLLKEMVHGTETDPSVRLEELSKRRDEIDAEMARVRAGEMPLLEETAVKDRFQQFLAIARELLGDFREVEHNFRLLDRRVRERITLWEGGKGELLEEIMGERDAIEGSDQGKSFRAFWDFLMSQAHQDELTELLETVLGLPAVQEMAPEPRLRRVHYDWLEAGGHTQRTVARLSQQLRRFLDDRAWLENRRIMEILGHIEANAIGTRDEAPRGTFMHMDAMAADIELPMERPLFVPKATGQMPDIELDTGDADIDPSVLFNQVRVDRAALRRRIRKALQDRTQVTLKALVAEYPLDQGLAELVTYLHLAAEGPHTVVDETTQDEVTWLTEAGMERRARFPRVIYMRSGA